MNTIRRRLLIVGVSALMLAGPMAASADGRVTFGDVSAAFQAFYNGVNLAEQGIPAAPADGYSRARLSPIQGNGQQFCENDWILVSVIVFIPKGSGADQLKHNDAVTIFADNDVQFELDSRALSELTTPLKVGRRVLGAELEPVWFQHWGDFVEPYSLAVGFHYLSADIILGGVPIFLPITFEVLSASDPYCTQ